MGYCFVVAGGLLFACHIFFIEWILRHRQLALLFGCLQILGLILVGIGAVIEIGWIGIFVPGCAWGLLWVICSIWDKAEERKQRKK